MYAGDFDAAAKEAQRTLQQNPAFAKAYLEIAIAALAAGDSEPANEAYDKMAQVDRSGASLAATGKADIALYTGQKIVDLWLARLDLGRAYEEAGHTMPKRSRSWNARASGAARPPRSSSTTYRRTGAALLARSRAGGAGTDAGCGGKLQSILGAAPRWPQRSACGRWSSASRILFASERSALRSVPRLRTAINIPTR